MIWKKRKSNLIVAVVLSMAFTILTLLLVIGPLHINHNGGINTVSYETLSAVIYWGLTLLLTWTFFFCFHKHPEFLFFLLIIFGIVVTVAGVFLWGYYA